MFRISLRALLVIAAFPALAAPPAAPDVTYRSATKQLLFDWNYVPKANYYEFWFKANAGAAWVKFGDRPSWNPHWVQNISAHLVHWSEMRWEVKACNPSGCTGTGPINIGSTIVLTPGFFTPPHPQNGLRFGETVAVSEDAQTAVANAGRVLVVFHRVNGRWIREAEFEPSRATGTTIASAALSRDGNLLVAGVSDERLGDEGENDRPHGAAYLFRRIGSTWTEERRLTDTRGRDFGSRVHVSETGERVVVNFRRDDFTPAGAAADIYTHVSSGWSSVTIVTPGADFCTESVLSGDGQTIARRCIYTGVARVELLGAPDWGLRRVIPLELPYSSWGYTWGPLAVDYAANTVASAALPVSPPPENYDGAWWNPQLAVFRRAGSAYEQVATLTPSAVQPKTYEKRSGFGTSVDVSRDGSYIAVTDIRDAIGGLVIPPPTSAGANAPRGAVYVFEKNGDGYRLRRHVGVTTLSDPARPVIGNVALGDDGRTLAVGEPASRSNGQGFADGRGNSSLVDAGALWLY